MPPPAQSWRRWRGSRGTFSRRGPSRALVHALAFDGREQHAQLARRQLEDFPDEVRRRRAVEQEHPRLHRGLETGIARQCSFHQRGIVQEVAEPRHAQTVTQLFARSSRQLQDRLHKDRFRKISAACLRCRQDKSASPVRLKPDFVQGLLGARCARRRSGEMPGEMQTLPAADRLDAQLLTGEAKAATSLTRSA
jgi:hypothetical protein